MKKLVVFHDGFRKDQCWTDVIQKDESVWKMRLELTMKEIFKYLSISSSAEVTRSISEVSVIDVKKGERIAVSVGIRQDGKFPRIEKRWSPCDSAPKIFFHLPVTGHVFTVEHLETANAMKANVTSGKVHLQCLTDFLRIIDDLKVHLDQDSDLALMVMAQAFRQDESLLRCRGR